MFSFKKCGKHPVVIETYLLTSKGWETRVAWFYQRRNNLNTRQPPPAPSLSITEPPSLSAASPSDKWKWGACKLTYLLSHFWISALSAVTDWNHNRIRLRRGRRRRRPVATPRVPAPLARRTPTDHHPRHVTPDPPAGPPREAESSLERFRCAGSLNYFTPSFCDRN